MHRKEREHRTCTGIGYKAVRVVMQTKPWSRSQPLGSYNLKSIHPSILIRGLPPHSYLYPQFISEIAESIWQNGSLRGSFQHLHLHIHLFQVKGSDSMMQPTFLSWSKKEKRKPPNDDCRVSNINIE